MNKNIAEYLNEIELQYNIKIIYACGVGSRAWGYHSIDSDYDIRFIYVHPRDTYLKLNPPLSSITDNNHSDYDISGWDLRKTLQLIHKSNVSAFEWINSPIIIKQDVNIVEQLKGFCKDNFSVKTCCYQYFGNIFSTYQKIPKDKREIKEVLGMLRHLLCAKWCIERGEIPPVSMEALLALMPQDLQNNAKTLIDHRNYSLKTNNINIDQSILDYIDDKELMIIDNVIKRLPARYDRNIETLETFFINTINAFK